MHSADADETLCDKLPAASDGLLKGKTLTAHETHVSAPKLLSNTRNFMLAPFCMRGNWDNRGCDGAVGPRLGCTSHRGTRQLGIRSAARCMNVEAARED